MASNASVPDETPTACGVLQYAQTAFSNASTFGPRMKRPLARTSFDRTFSMGPGTALTGPAARGDAGTIGRNLEALSRDAPEAVEAYVALAAVAAALARDAGRIDGPEIRRIDEELDRWR